MLKGDRYRLILLFVLGIASIGSTGCLIYGSLIMSEGSTNLSFVFSSAPAVFIALGMGLFALQLVSSWVGFFSALKKHRNLLMSYLVVATFTLICNLAIFIFILLFGNGVFGRSSSEFSESTEGLITKWIVQSPELWKDFQDTNSCCGFNFRSTYLSSQNGYPNLPVFELEDVYSGSKCSGAPLDKLVDLHKTYPMYSNEAQAEADKTIYFPDVTFTCYYRVVSTGRDYASNGGIIVGLLILFQFTAVWLSSTLLFSVKEENGGLKTEPSLDLSVSLDPSRLGRRKQRCFCCGPQKRNGTSNPVIKYT